MKESDLSLPHFSAPPIVELVLSVQFEPLVRFRAVHLGLLWERYADRFPKTEERLPLDPVFEEFGTRRPLSGGVQLQLVDPPLVPRCWFLSEPETELIQIQPDRFIVNWKKEGQAGYPLFGHVRDLFAREFEEFRAFVAEKELGEIVPNQCEVTYIDHIASGSKWERHGQLERAFTTWESIGSSARLAEPEDVRFAVRYVIPDDAGQPLGRLHIEVVPGYRRADDVPIFVMTTTARGRPVGTGIDGVLRFFDLGRGWAVEAFSDFTSPSMHAEWGQA